MKVPYVQRVKRPDGRVALYFRKGDYREGPLRSPDDTPELKAEVDAILNRLARAEAAQTPQVGTIGGLMRRYKKSAEFISRAVSTKKEYERLIDEIEADVGDVLLRDVDAGWVRDLRDTWAPRGHKAANDRVQMLKNAFKPAVRDKRIGADPFAGLEKIAPPHGREEAHPAWENVEVEAFIELAMTRKMPGLARAAALGRWGGFRRGTICALPVSARSPLDEGRTQWRLKWMTEKRRVQCDKREDARLTALLSKTPSPASTIAYNQRGERWKERQLNQAFDRLVAKLAEAGLVRPNLTIHGLRHARGIELAHAGASDAEIMAQLEHATDRAAKIYRRQAERVRMADSAQDRIDEAVRLQNVRREKA